MNFHAEADRPNSRTCNYRMVLSEPDDSSNLVVFVYCHAKSGLLCNGQHSFAAGMDAKLAANAISACIPDTHSLFCPLPLVQKANTAKGFFPVHSRNVLRAFRETYLAGPCRFCDSFGHIFTSGIYWPGMLGQHKDKNPQPAFPALHPYKSSAINTPSNLPEAA